MHFPQNTKEEENTGNQSKSKAKARIRQFKRSLKEN